MESLPQNELALALFVQHIDCYSSAQNSLTQQNCSQVYQNAIVSRAIAPPPFFGTIIILAKLLSL